MSEIGLYKIGLAFGFYRLKKMKGFRGQNGMLSEMMEFWDLSVRGCDWVDTVHCGIWKVK